MKKILLLLLLTIPLCSCVVGAVAIAGATAGGAVVYDNRSMKTMNDDQQAYQYAQRWLNYDSVLKGQSHIVIAVFNHVALLVGQAKTPEIRDRAYQIVAQVKNISRIYNEVTISNPSSELERMSDSWLTTKVRTALLAKPGLNSNNLKVITEAGIVYLMGDITHEQANLAADAARRVSGVIKVVKVFQYQT